MRGLDYVQDVEKKEPTWNLTQTLHIHIFLGKVLPQIMCKVQLSLPRKGHIYPQCYPGTPVYPCFSIFALLVQKYDQKRFE